MYELHDCLCAQLVVYLWPWWEGFRYERGSHLLAHVLRDAQRRCVAVNCRVRAARMGMRSAVALSGAREVLVYSPVRRPESGSVEADRHCHEVS